MLDCAEMFRRGVGEGRVLERLVVVSPYVSDGFFTSLVGELKPKTVFLTVDQATSASSVNETKAAIGKKRLGGVSYAASPDGGLVHAKLYFLQWGGATTTCYLFWGSANATGGGFDHNAETLSWVRLTKANHADAIAYFDTLTKPTGNVEELKVALAAGAALLLPRFSFSPKPATPDFDAWVQRGWLYHPFLDDQTFLRFSVRTDAPLPGGPVQELLSSRGFAPDGEANMIRRRYLTFAEGPSPKKERDWRSRYFVDTSLGLWTSSRCYRTRKDEFVKASAEAREGALLQFDGATAGDITAWTEEFVSEIRGLAEQFATAGLCDPSKIFKYREHDGALDEKHYLKLAAGQVDRDRRKAGDEWFRLRFTSGWMQSETPRFRSDATAWRSFISSWEAALAYDVGRKGTRSCLAKSVGAAIHEVGGFEDGASIVDWLRTHWNEVRDAVMGFYQ